MQWLTRDSDFIHSNAYHDGPEHILHVVYQDTTLSLWPARS